MPSLWSWLALLKRMPKALLKPIARTSNLRDWSGPCAIVFYSTADRIRLMAAGVRDVAKLSDPTFETLAEWLRPNGLRIRKIRVPLGVVGIIYESRPNVTVDTVALTFKTGNAVVLRGGKEAPTAIGDW